MIGPGITSGAFGHALDQTGSRVQVRVGLGLWTLPARHDPQGWSRGPLPLSRLAGPCTSDDCGPRKADRS